jgi:hypothetical protein
MSQGGDSLGEVTAGGLVEIKQDRQVVSIAELVSDGVAGQVNFGLYSVE